MTHRTPKAIRREYREAYQIHNLNVQAYCDGKCDFATVIASSNWLSNIKAEHQVETECRKYFGKST